MPHLVATLIYLSQNYSYYIRGDRSPLKSFLSITNRESAACGGLNFNSKDSKESG